ncbi:hypothetical protein [Flammeovirga sp. SubArs3]|uniref:hypothetical protein n=1 Tax=Flammeovirga sp. SubArs3 TaxID=2995316 RepID=UPI00248ACA5B|nr:hypothetical protein [Flammeovirga sp. SubArs3]
MSSHHIVKDDQEPALLILSVNESNIDTIHNLLEWSPIVITNTATLEQLVSMDIKVDWVLINPKEEEEVHQIMQYQIPYHIRKKENTDIGEALLWLKEKNHQALNIVDDTLTKELKSQLLHQELIKTVVIYSQNKRIYRSKTSPFDKWMKSHQQFSFDIEVETENLKFDADNQSYSVINDGTVTIKAEAPFYIYETLRV